MLVYLFIIFTVFYTGLAHAAFEIEGILHEQVVQDSDEGEGADENISEISQEQLDTMAAGASSIDDLLRLSDIATTARGPRSSGEAPQVRGLDKNKIFVMVDGSRQNFNTGHNSMIALDTENLKAVKVYKSSASLSQSGSLGGGVNFVTKDAEDFLQRGKKTGAEFKTRYASANAENSLNAKYITKNKGGRSAYISMSSTSAKNLQLSNGETLDRSSFEDRSVLVKNKFGRWGTKLEVFQREDDAPTDPTLNPPDSKQYLFSENTTRRTNLSVDYARKNLKSMAYYNGFILDKQRVTNQELKTRRIDTVGAKVENRLGQNFFGAEFFQDRLTSESAEGEIQSYPNAMGTNLVAFAEHRFDLGSQWTVTPGARLNTFDVSAEGDFESKNGGMISRSILVEKRWSSKLKTSFALSEGFNAPRVNEIYPSGLHNPGDGFIFKSNFFIPNEDLTVETSLNREFSMNYEDNFAGGAGIVQFNFNAYENSANDFIMTERIDRSIFEEEDGTTQFVNVPEVTLWGGEISAKVIYDAYEATLSYTKVRGRNETRDQWLQDLPADQYNFRFNYFLDKHQVTMGYLGFYALEQNRTNPEVFDQRTVPTESYFIHNVYLNKKFNNFDINFRVDNLGNKRYRRHASHLFEAREDYKLGLTYRINTI